MAQSELTETRLKTAQVFNGVLLDVRRDEVRLPDGRTSVREVIHHPGAAAVLPVRDDGRLVLVRQYRYAIDQETIEVPAGKRDANEAAAVTAERELAEEIGYGCHRLESLGMIHPSMGYCDETIEIFLARDLFRQDGSLDEDEFVQPLETTFDEALAWVREGKITDVKTIIALDWATRALAGEWRQV